MIYAYLILAGEVTFEQSTVQTTKDITLMNDL